MRSSTPSPAQLRNEPWRPRSLHTVVSSAQLRSLLPANLLATNLSYLHQRLRVMGTMPGGTGNMTVQWPAAMT